MQRAQKSKYEQGRSTDSRESRGLVLFGDVLSAPGAMSGYESIGRVGMDRANLVGVGIDVVEVDSLDLGGDLQQWSTKQAPGRSVQAGLTWL